MQGQIRIDTMKIDDFFFDRRFFLPHTVMYFILNIFLMYQSWICISKRLPIHEYISELSGITLDSVLVTLA
jgi:hypothetical protein